MTVARTLGRNQQACKSTAILKAENGPRARKNDVDRAHAPLVTRQSHPCRPPVSFGGIEQLLQKRVSQTRDPTRRLGGALAAQRTVSGRSGVVLAPCKKRRMLELTLGQQELTLGQQEVI